MQFIGSGALWGRVWAIATLSQKRAICRLGMTNLYPSVTMTVVCEERTS